jgi:hypothetical protein
VSSASAASTSGVVKAFAAPWTARAARKTTNAPVAAAAREASA